MKRKQGKSLSREGGSEGAVHDDALEGRQARMDFPDNLSVSLTR